MPMEIAKIVDNYKSNVVELQDRIIEECTIAGNQIKDYLYGRFESIPDLAVIKIYMEKSTTYSEGNVHLSFSNCPDINAYGEYCSEIEDLSDEEFEEHTKYFWIASDDNPNEIPELKDIFNELIYNIDLYKVLSKVFPIEIETSITRQDYEQWKYTNGQNN